LATHWELNVGFVYFIIGAVLSALFAQAEPLNWMVLGGLVGWLLYRLQQLSEQLRKLAADEELRRSHGPAQTWVTQNWQSPSTADSAPKQAQPTANPATNEEATELSQVLDELAALPINEATEQPSPVRQLDTSSAASEAVSTRLPKARFEASEPSGAISQSKRDTVRLPPPAPMRPHSADAPQSTWLEAFIKRANWPVVIGGLVLFVGIGALLKYAAEVGWLKLPPEFRLGSIALAAIVALVFAWRQRESKPNFATAMQGVALGVLMLCAYGGLRLYQLYTPFTALSLMVAVVALGIALAFLQGSQILSVLSATAGFAAPVLASTGSGNPVSLFAYLATLNLGVLFVALHQQWPWLRRVGFVGTFVLSAAWAAKYYRPEHRELVEPFLLSFFAVYVLVAFLACLRSARVDGDEDAGFDPLLMFGTPTITLLLLSLMTANSELLALHTLIGGIAYGVLARLWRARFPMLAQSAIALCLALLTLSIPLAFDGSVTSALFALEGAGLVWFAARRSQRWPWMIGALLQVVAAGLLLSEFQLIQPQVFDRYVIGTLILAVGAWLSAHFLLRDLAQKELGIGLLLASALWLMIAGGLVVDDGMTAPLNTAMLLVLAGILSLFLALSRLQASALLVVLLMTLALPIWFAAAIADNWQQAWSASYAIRAAVALAALYLSWQWQHRLACGNPLLANLAFCFGLGLVLTLMLSAYGMTHAMSESARVMLATLPSLAFAAVWLAPPGAIRAGISDDEAHIPRWLVLSLMVYWSWRLLFLQSNMSPHIPLLNPIELIQIALMVVWFGLLKRAAHEQTPAHQLAKRALWITAGFAYTMAAVRACAQWFELPWNARLLDHSQIQSALSLAWTALAVALMIRGHRSTQRILWMAGAVLLAVVAGKLLLIDRGYLGSLAGISAFIGTGLLMATVGYFAPIPPAQEEAGS
jgi:uncharacterized membrane protein